MNQRHEKNFRICRSAYHIMNFRTFIVNFIHSKVRVNLYCIHIVYCTDIEAVLEIKSDKL